MDTGAVADMLATHINRCKLYKVDNENVGKYMRIAERLVEEYLISNIPSKQIVNQRLWGLTGVASFARLTGRGDLEDFVRQQVTDVLRCIDATGGIGYILTSDNKDPKGSFSTLLLKSSSIYSSLLQRFDWESIIDNKISELIENIRIYQTNLGQKLVVSDPKTLLYERSR